MNRDNLLEQLQKLLKRKKSKKFYAERLNITEEEVEELLTELRTTPDIETDFSELEEKLGQLIGEDTDHTTGDKIYTLQSLHPLTPKEIEELSGVDGITTYVARSWLKSHKNSTWTYSIDVRYRVSDFYSGKELKKKIQELLPDYSPEYLPDTNKYPIQKALFIYLSDDHAGAVMENSIFENAYSGEIYTKRLLSVIDSVKSLDESFENVYIVSLGDQQNGWNSQTTRGGHEVPSESNKKQFDIYISARRLFYNELFKSGIGENYTLIALENSNHSGKGFSYMADKALEMYLEAKFPDVITRFIDLAVDIVEYGQHVFGYTHGKDERVQKSPLPLNLNDRTDSFLYQYFDRKGYSARTSHIHLVKGDLHQYNVNMGKSCRYVNVPSIMGSTDYSELNFGDTRPGALVEIVDKNSSNIMSLPIWFKK